MSSPASRFVASVEGLRGFAAACVVIVHFYRMAENSDFLPPQIGGVVAILFESLGHGVELFFLISGFLIPASMVRHGDVGIFLRDRALRIFPLFIILHLIVFTMGYLVHYKMFKGIELGDYALLFVSNLLFLAPIVGLPMVQQNSWTLTYEWTFYLYVSLAFANSSGSWFGKTIIALLGIGMVIAFPLFLYFAIGALVAYFGWKLQIHWSAGAAIATICLIAFFYLSQVEGVLVAMVPATIVFLLLLDQNSFIGSFFSKRLVRYLGRISFSLYLLHPFVLYPLQAQGARLARDGMSHTVLFLAFVAIGTALTLIASHFSYRVIELGLRDRLERWLKSHTATARIV